MLFRWQRNLEKNQPRRPESKSNKVVITGPGRSGTTFLMLLLGELRFDIGQRDILSPLNGVSHAGLEQGLHKHAHVKSPLTDAYVIKSPLLYETLDQAMARGDLIIDQLYIPLRNIDDIVASRGRVASIDRTLPGGFYHASTAEEQRNQVGIALFQLMNVVAKYDIPHTIMSFPRLVNDPEYLYRKLDYLCSGISYSRFLQAFQSIAKPDLVHQFGKSGHAHDEKG